MKSIGSRAVGRAEKPMNTGKRNGRHEETRTPDLYRVNLLLLNTFNNLTGLLGLPNHRSYRKNHRFTGVESGVHAAR